MKKWMTIIALLTMFSLTLMACSPKNPTANTGSANASGQPAAQNGGSDKVTKLQALTFGEGSMGQILFIGISEIVNKNNPSIRITPQTSIGAESLIEFDKNPDKRKTMIVSGSHLAPDQAKLGIKPFSKPIDKQPLGLFTYGPGSSAALATLDPNIKEIKDLAGKKVDIGPPGSNSYEVYYPIFEASGILDKIKLTPTESLGASIQALRDGLVDVGWNSIVPTSGPSPAFKELITQKKEVFFVNVDDELFIKAQDKTHLSILPVKFKKGQLTQLYKSNYDFPQRDVSTSMYVPGYFASADVPEEVIYQLIKTIIQHKSELKNYHSAGQTMADHMGEFLQKKYMHPGAVRAYQEAGMKAGID